MVSNPVKSSYKTTQELLVDTICSAEDLTSYLQNLDVKNAKQGITSSYVEEFKKSGKWPTAEEVQIPKNSKVLKNGSGDIDWSQTPCDGYTTKTVKKYDKLTGDIVEKKVAIKEEYMPEIGEVIDRYGPSNGRYTSPTKDGICSYDQRSLPYVEDASKYHQYIVKKYFNTLSEAIENCTDSNFKSDIDNLVARFYDGDYSAFYKKLKTFKGEIAPGFSSTGEGIQYELPISVKWLEKLGFLEEIK